jgi:hypothetical protein
VTYDVLMTHFIAAAVGAIFALLWSNLEIQRLIRILEDGRK